MNVNNLLYAAVAVALVFTFATSDVFKTHVVQAKTEMQERVLAVRLGLPYAVVHAAAGGQ